MDDVRQLAESAAKEVLDSSRVFALHVSSGFDSVGDPAYFVDFVVKQENDREFALRKRLALRRSVRHRLVEAGDDTYPYIRIINQVSATAGD